MGHNTTRIGTQHLRHDAVQDGDVVHVHNLEMQALPLDGTPRSIVWVHFHNTIYRRNQCQYSHAQPVSVSHRLPTRTLSIGWSHCRAIGLLHQVEDLQVRREVTIEEHHGSAVKHSDVSILLFHGACVILGHLSILCFQRQHRAVLAPFLQPVRRQALQQVRDIDVCRHEEGAYVLRRYTPAFAPPLEWPRMCAGVGLRPSTRRTCAIPMTMPTLHAAQFVSAVAAPMAVSNIGATNSPRGAILPVLR